jgi:cytochrome c553
VPVRRVVEFIVASALIGASSAAADQPGAAFGAYLSGECVTCHQPSGAANGIPPIVGWEEARFISALREYRGKTKPNEAMRAIAARLEDDEIAALAAYFATLK